MQKDYWSDIPSQSFALALQQSLEFFNFMADKSYKNRYNCCSITHLGHIQLLAGCVLSGNEGNEQFQMYKASFL